MDTLENNMKRTAETSTNSNYKPFGISGAIVKWIAIITMFIDHIGASIFWQYTATNHYSTDLLKIYHVLRYVGRISFPLFIFLLVEGFYYTKNRNKYLLQMLIFGIVSEIPFDLAFYRTPFHWQSQNVYFTLCIGLLVIYFLEKIDEKWKTAVGSNLVIKTYIKALTMIAGFAIAYFAKTDYDISGVAGIIVMYSMRNNVSQLPIFQNVRGSIIPANHHPKTRGHKSQIKLSQLRTPQMRFADMFAFACTCLILLFSSITEIYGLFGLPVIYAYNGTRGKQMKYFFYLFYPVHLLLLWIAMKICGLA